MHRTTTIRLVASELRVVLGSSYAGCEPSTASRSPTERCSAASTEMDPSVSDLAAPRGVKPQSMAQTVDDLEIEGLVTRRPDPDDRRRALVELTDAGVAPRRPSSSTERAGSRGDHEQLWSEEEQAMLDRTVGLLRRISES